MEFRVVKVVGWEFVIQVLPEEKVIEAKQVNPAALPRDFAEELAFILIDED